MLGEFLEANGVRQIELAEGIAAGKAQVNRWSRDPLANITRQRIDDILRWLSKRLDRPVSYEEAFKSSAEQALSPAVG